MTSRAYLSPIRRQSANNASLVQTMGRQNQLFWRAIVFMMLITTFMGACAYRLVYLQVIQGQYNRELAEQNRIRPIPIPSDRGYIADRNGKLIVANQLSRAVYLWPRQQSAEQWRQTLERLSPVLNVPAPEMIRRLEQAGYTSPLPVRVTQSITPEIFVALEERSTEFPGVEIMAGSRRHYPHGNLAAHVLGYIGEASEEEMDANPKYPSGMIVGKTGIERIANSELEGVWGNRLIEVNAGGEEVRLLGNQPAISGKPVETTLDLALQQAAERGLNGRRGAVVALNVKTGEILAMASAPSFSPEVFTGRLSESDWEKLQSGSQPLLNRALQGYPPGSTFKIVTAAAGMQSGKYSPDSRIGTSAFISMGGTQFWEHSNHGYGVIGFKEALAVSSNTFFYRVGLTIGPEEISKWGRALGIGTTEHAGLDGNYGSIPTPAEKEELYGEPWYAGDSVSTAIGQGLVQATPLELAVMISAIANGGSKVYPHLLKSQTADAVARKEATGLDPAAIAKIREGLVATVQMGTARRLNDGSIPLVAGKTGTSENPGPKPHALFVTYGPVSDPQIGIAVIVENGGYGGVAALPIAHEMYKAYFGRQQPAQTPAK